MSIITRLPAFEPAEPDMAVARANAAALRVAASQVLDNQPLLPVPLLTAARRELEAALSARTPEHVADLLFIKLMEAYPIRPDPLPEVYMATMAATMQGYPPDVVRSAARQVVRLVKFVPAVAEFVEAAEAIMTERRVLYAGVTRQLDAHARRHAVALAEAEARRREDEFAAGMDKVLAEAWRGVLPEAGLFRAGAAGYRAFRVADSIAARMALASMTPWAVRAWGRASLFGRADALAQAARWGTLEVLALAEALADGRDAHGAAIVARAEVSDGQPGACSVAADQVREAVALVLGRLSCEAATFAVAPAAVALVPPPIGFSG